MKKAGVLFVALIMPLLVGFKQDNPIKPLNYVQPKQNTAVTNTQQTKPDRQKYSEVTSSPKIMDALDTMVGTSGEWSRNAILGDNLSKRPVKVSFKNLGTLSPAYKDFDALGWKDGDGQLYIYINEKHRNAPAEALGCLLSHEAVHQDEYSSIEEETYCWGFEADVWIQMEKRNPQLKQIGYNVYPLVDRLNTLKSMFVNANYTTKRIYQEVSTNPGYSNLPMYSPGFGPNDQIKTVADRRNPNSVPAFTPADYKRSK